MHKRLERLKQTACVLWNCAFACFCAELFTSVRNLSVGFVHLCHTYKKKIPIDKCWLHLYESNVDL